MRRTKARMEVVGDSDKDSTANRVMCPMKECALPGGGAMEPAGPCSRADGPASSREHRVPAKGRIRGRPRPHALVGAAAWDGCARGGSCPPGGRHPVQIARYRAHLLQNGLTVGSPCADIHPDARTRGHPSASRVSPAREVIIVPRAGRRLACLTAALLFVLGSPARAGPPAHPDDVFSLVQEQTVTAVNKRPLPLSETPSSVTVIPEA